MGKHILFFSLFCFLFLFCPFPPGVQAEDRSLSITTYYPIPYGKYETLKSRRLIIGQFEEDSLLTPEDETMTREDIGEGGIYVEKGLVLRRMTELPGVDDYQTGSMIYYRPDSEVKGEFRFLVDDKWEKLPNFPVAHLYVKMQGTISGKRGWVCGKYYTNTWDNWIPCILRPGVTDSKGAKDTAAVNRNCTMDKCTLSRSGSTGSSSTSMTIEVKVPSKLRRYFREEVSCPTNAIAVSGSQVACLGCSGPLSYGWSGDTFSISGTGYCSQGGSCGCCACSWGNAIPFYLTLHYEGFND